MNIKIIQKFIIITLFLFASAHSICQVEVMNFSGYLCLQKEPIGIGSNGSAYLIQKDGIKYILKEQQNSENAKKELTILQEMKNKEYIVQLIDYAETWNSLYFIISYGSQGTLYDFKEKSEYFNSFTNVLIFYNKLMLGMKSIHKSGYVHADLKAENVVVDENNNPIIIDFDSAVYKDSKNLPRGTFNYMAPEILKQFELGDYVIFTENADLFSFGVMLFETVKGRLPFKMTRISYSQMMNMVITFNIGDFSDFYDLTSSIMKPLSSRESIDNVQDSILATMIKTTYESLSKPVYYSLVDYANEEETPVNMENIMMVLGIVLTIVIIFLIFFCIYFIKKMKMNDHKNTMKTAFKQENYCHDQLHPNNMYGISKTTDLQVSNN